jgi:glycine/D-amino acid oxidase-like deaminating enzyme
MSEAYDVIVLGGGIVGTSTLFHLADLGAKRTLLLERGELASGGTGKSCANIRTHYSILSNTDLAVRSLEMIRDLKHVLDDPDADAGFVNSGYLILAEEGDTATQLAANLALQREHGAMTEQVSADQVLELHPLLDVSDVAAIGYEPESGYADPHMTTHSLARAAKRRGAEIRTGTSVAEIIEERGEVRGVRTSAGPIYAPSVISALGPWTQALTGPLGIEIPLATYRHTVLTLEGAEPYRNDLPIVKDLTVENKMYFRSEAETLLVGTGDSGVSISDPDDMDAIPDPELIALQSRQVAHRVPSFRGARIANAWFGPYDVTPDWNPVIDQAPGISGLLLAFGFSGHGFKLAPAVGRMLAQLALGRPRDVDISPYSLSRFIEGRQLTGVYGAGSIS